MDAVRCILIRAEEEAHSYDDSERDPDIIKASLTYVSSKYSWVTDGDNDTQPVIPDNMKNDSFIYRYANFLNAKLLVICRNKYFITWKVSPSSEREYFIFQSQITRIMKKWPSSNMGFISNQ